MEQNSFGRLLSVLVSPAKTFQAIAARPSWVAAMIVLVLIGTVSGFVAMQKVDFDQAIRAQMEERGNMSAEQIDNAVAMAGKFKNVGLIFGVGFSIGSMFLVGLIFWVAFKMLGSESSYISSLATSLHAMMPNAVSGLLSIPVVLGKEEVSLEAVQQQALLASSLAVLAPEGTSKYLVTLLGSVDVFSVWTVALLALGYGVTAKVSKGTAWGVVAALWAVWILTKLGLAALR